MKKNILLLIALSMTILAMAQKSTDNFTGRWKTAESAIIEINKSGLAFIGKPQEKDVVVLNNLTFTDGKWKGILSNPKKNTTCVNTNGIPSLPGAFDHIPIDFRGIALSKPKNADTNFAFLELAISGFFLIK